jgi:hypothetical protein
MVFGDNPGMAAILYPVAVNAEQALSAPLGLAARAREASVLAGEAVTFVTEPIGSAYATRDAALDAHSGRIEDDRPGRMKSLLPEERILSLVERAAPRGGRTRALAPVQPAFKEGRRWPEPKSAPAPTVWRVMISYWRVGVVAQAQPTGRQARDARRKGREEMDAEALRALTRQPLQAVKPQQPLDIGLFETRLPEAPHIIVPDE